MSQYEEIYRASMSDPAAFWARQAELVDWVTPPRQILDASNPPFYRWFPGAELNTCHNAVDRHVAAGHADRVAILYDSPVTGKVSRMTYGELRKQVGTLAAALRELGAGKGDRVVVYMPMIPELIVSMLACARLGAVHSVVFGGFAAHELAARIDDARPAVLITASCGIEPSRVLGYKQIVDAALELSEHPPSSVVVKQREELTAELSGAADHDWDELMRRHADADVECVTVAATDPLYILYTSGTTGRPKGIVRDNGGHAVAMAWSLPHIFDVHAGQVWWAASDIGWVVGHSYIVYAPLINGATTVLFEGKPIGTPDAGAFWRVVERYRVEGLFTAPTAIRAIKKEDPSASCLTGADVSSLRNLFLAGERLDPDTYAWASAALGIPVVDNWWQTETGWPIAANLRGLEEVLPIKPGSPSVPVPGFEVTVLDETGAEVPPLTEGAVCLKLPLPPGTLLTVWGDDKRFVSSYLSAYDGYYLSGDGGFVDEDGYLFVMGRTDDVINVAGHRLSTGSIEAVLAQHPAVAECAVIGAADSLKGQVPRAFVVLKSGYVAGDDLLTELRSLVRDQIGAIASLSDVAVVDALPKTRSGKVLRKSMREIADHGETQVPATIEDAAVLEGLRSILHPNS
jgi:propionyl-CoA synthetase